MPVDTTGLETVTISVAQARDFARRAFAAVGVPDEDAAKAAVALVDADLHGVSTHGIKNLSGYVRAVQRGQVKARPGIRVTGGTGALRQMSGGWGLGHVAAQHGVERAIELAREHGVGCVFMRESNHYGASGYWARLPVRHGMAGFAVTNASASIAPWGGTEPVVGNNPPAWAVPVAATGGGGGGGGGGNDGDGADGADGDGSAGGASLDGEGPIDAVFLDMALSVVAGNRLDIYARRGQPIPLGWALDAEGQPTTDARARQKGGTFAPVAEYKGFGMALLCSLFTSLLAGGPFDDEMLGQGAPTERCHWFLAIDVRQLVPLEEFTRRVQAVSGRVRATRRKAGVERLVMPGDLERERVQRQLRDGLQIEPFIVEDLKALAGSLGIEPGL